MELAAVKVQARVRGFQARSKFLSTLDDLQTNISAEIDLCLRGLDSVSGISNEADDEMPSSTADQQRSEQPLQPTSDSSSTAQCPYAIFIDKRHHSERPPWKGGTKPLSQLNKEVRQRRARLAQLRAKHQVKDKSKTLLGCGAMPRVPRSGIMSDNDAKSKHTQSQSLSAAATTKWRANALRGVTTALVVVIVTLLWCQTDSSSDY